MIDWQAYMDGSLAEEERMAAEHRLQTDPQARRELDGLQNFIGTVRNVGLSEDVPIDRLVAFLPSTESRKRKSWLPRLSWAMGLAATAVAAVLIVPQIIGKSNASTDLYTSDPIAATSWAKRKLNMDIPVMDLGQDAKLFYVHEGKDRCCFDYEVDGETYHVNVRRDNRGVPLEGRSVRLKTGVDAGVSRGVRWRERQYEFFIVGPDSDVSLDLADRTSALLNQRA